MNAQTLMEEFRIAHLTGQHDKAIQALRDLIALEEYLKSVDVASRQEHPLEQLKKSASVN